MALLALLIGLLVFYHLRRKRVNLIKSRRQATDATNYYARRLQQDLRQGPKRTPVKPVSRPLEV